MPRYNARIPVGQHPPTAELLGRRPDLADMDAIGPFVVQVAKEGA